MEYGGDISALDKVTADKRLQATIFVAEVFLIHSMNYSLTLLE